MDELAGLPEDANFKLNSLFVTATIQPPAHLSPVSRCRKRRGLNKTESRLTPAISCSQHITRNGSGRTVPGVIRWDEKSGLRTGCGVRSQVIDVLKAQEIKETGNEEG
jgi:hypothetical protein